MKDLLTYERNYDIPLVKFSSRTTVSILSHLDRRQIGARETVSFFHPIYFHFLLLFSWNAVDTYRC